MQTENLKLKEIEKGIAEFVLSQPARRNAINAQMWSDIPKLLQKAAKKPGLKVLIIRGDGEHFASGADISEFETLYATRSSAQKVSNDINTGFQAIADFPLPTIAMIRGACVGGGCGLALACDIRFADTSSRFAVTPAKLGLVYPYGDLTRLIEAVGIPNAKDILFSARNISAEEAKELGLINRLCNPDELLRQTIDYARDIAALSAFSSTTHKQMFSAYQGGQSCETSETLDWFLDGFVSDDFKEGYKAFLEKRKPDFR